MSDGGLRGLYSRHLPEVHWQAIETGGTGRGIPDVNGCWGGTEFWVENKHTAGWCIPRDKMRPEQVAWLERRARAGGRVFVAVRQTGRGRDDLWLLRHDAARIIRDGSGLDELPRHVLLGHWSGGPARWDWGAFLCAVAGI